MWARLTWQADDPERLAADLARRLGRRRRGTTGRSGLRDPPGNATLEVVPWRRESPSDDPLPGGRLVFEGVPGGLAKPAPAELPPFVLIGVGWATVELDRAETELAEWLAGEAAGTRRRRRRPDPRRPGAAAAALTACPGEEIVLLEPTTEGRLAARSSVTARGRARCTCDRRAASMAGWPSARAGRGSSTREAGRSADRSSCRRPRCRAALIVVG